MMNKLKNIIIINDFDYIQGGASKVAIDTANILCERYNVIFFSGDSNDKTTLNKHVTIVSTFQGEAMKNKNKLCGIVNGIYNFKAKRILKNILLNLNSEETIIHVHSWTKCLSSSIFDIAWKMNFKVVLTMHDYFTACPNGGYFNYKKNVICEHKPLSSKCIRCNCDSRNYLFKVYRIIRQFVQNKVVRLNDRLTDVISLSDFSEKILKKTLSSNTKIHRVLNPIDLDDNRKKIDYKLNEYYLYVGRISKEKGVDIFCDAITKLHLNGVVVGDGDQKEKLEKEYSMVKFVGWKNSSEVKEYMKKARALIFPSRLFEVAPLTPLEAMQYGIPLITSDCNAAIDYILDNNGESFHINEENSLANCINFFEHNIEKYNVNIEKYNGNYQMNLICCYKDILKDKSKG